jgi:hypothetical protein
MHAVTVEQMGRLFANVEASTAAKVSGPGATADPVELLRGALEKARAEEPEIETKCSLADPSLQFVFVTLCERYGIDVYRTPKQRKTSVTIRGPRSFIQGVLWPMATEMMRLLDSWMADQTQAIVGTWEARSPRRAASKS